MNNTKINQFDVESCTIVRKGKLSDGETRTTDVLIRSGDHYLTITLFHDQDLTIQLTNQEES